MPNIYIDAVYRGRGYGPAALNELFVIGEETGEGARVEMLTVRAEISPDNLAAIRCFQKAGFSQVSDNALVVMERMTKAEYYSGE